jgi:hypothetical protein
MCHVPRCAYTSKTFAQLTCTIFHMETEFQDFVQVCMEVNIYCLLYVYNNDNDI